MTNSRIMRDERWLVAAIFLAAVMTFGYQSVRLGQDTNFDLRNYHYYNGYALLHGRLGFDYAPAGIQTYLNPVLDVPVYLLIRTLPPRWVGFTLGAVHGVAFWLIFLLARSLAGRDDRTHSPLFALICAGVGMYGAGAMSELGTTFHDLTLTPFVLASILLLVRGPRPGTTAVVASGFLLGAAVGLKYTFAIYAPGLGLALAILGWESKRQVAALVQWGAGALIGFGITAGYWMWQLWWRFANPFGYFYNGVFRSPYFEPLNFRDTRFFPHSGLESLFYPFYFRASRFSAGEIALQDARFAIVYVLVGAVIVTWLVRRAKEGTDRVQRVVSIPRAHGMLLAFFVCSYVLWQVLFSIYRYVIPLEVIAPLAIYLLLRSLIARPYTRLVTCSGVFLIIVGAVVAPNWGRVQWAPAFFGTVVPSVRDPSRGLVLISVSASEPIGFLIPDFPEQFRFVRIAPSFVTPGTRLAEDIHAVVSNHEGPTYVLSDSAEVVHTGRTLEEYGLALSRDSCREVTNNIVRGILWCEAERTLK